MPGRFDWRYELANIRDGMDLDLQQQVGQTVPWYVFDPESSEVDPVYDVGSSSGIGRRWKDPQYLRVLSAVKVEGRNTVNDRGLYTVSTLRLAISVHHAREAGLESVVFTPEQHEVDRVVYEGKVFGVREVRSRGVLTADYAVVGVDCQQIKAEELVNDPQFAAFMPLDQD